MAEFTKQQVLDRIKKGESLERADLRNLALAQARLTGANLSRADLEGANLEHSARFADAFRAAGDDDGARILDRVEREETAHVAFALRWFEHFTGKPLDYAAFRAALPAPLTPAMMQGRPLNHHARERAGFDAEFLRQLAAEPSTAERRAT